MTQIIPHPANVPGDFYVEYGCCTSCNVPFTVAPDLFTALDNGHCFVSKQPSSIQETYRMTQAFAAQDMRCIRYKGSNRIIKIKLIAMGEGEQCDQLEDVDLITLNQEIQADLAIKKAKFK